MGAPRIGSAASPSPRYCRGRARPRPGGVSETSREQPRLLPRAAPVALPPHARRSYDVYVTTHVLHAVLTPEQPPRPAWYHHRSRKMRHALRFPLRDSARQHLAGSQLGDAIPICATRRVIDDANHSHAHTSTVSTREFENWGPKELGAPILKLFVQQLAACSSTRRLRVFPMRPVGRRTAFRAHVPTPPLGGHVPLTLQSSIWQVRNENSFGALLCKCAAGITSPPRNVSSSLLEAVSTA
ncbi:hypothetical protein HPB50_001508 [Hyalomma asiaticum]|uniref:Uncharacterized protein n=1 Tax=Hyalomma asiaticum TaxID=266040 RepID=A0ACB7TAM5_HYAAI|nr:hypothetical protein HPB50_001508 [Hyalomma asiaticum]